MFSIIENDVNIILSKKPDKRHVVELLAENAYEYKELAIALGVDHTFVEGLKYSDKDIINLDKTIQRWIQTQCSPVNWHTIIESVEGFIFGKNVELGDKIRDWLKEDKHFLYYREKDT